TLTLRPEIVGDDRLLLVDNVMVQVLKYNGNPIGLQFPPHVELTVKQTEPGVRGDTASGGVTKPATLETGLEIRVPLFIKEGEKGEGPPRAGRGRGRGGGPRPGGGGGVGGAPPPRHCPPLSAARAHTSV